MTDALDDLDVVLTALGLVLARERAAIARLDVEQMIAAEDDKRGLAERIAELLRGPMPADADRRIELARRVRRAHNELAAQAMLVSAAAEAVRTLLGEGEPSGYDRRARSTSSSRPIRVITAL